MPQDSPRLPEETCQAARVAALAQALTERSRLLPSVPIKVQRPARPLPDAADAVAAAAAKVQADAEMVGAMLAEIRGGWLWGLLTAPKPFVLPKHFL